MFLNRQLQDLQSQRFSAALRTTAWALKADPSSHPGCTPAFELERVDLTPGRACKPTPVSKCCQAEGRGACCSGKGPSGRLG